MPRPQRDVQRGIRFRSLRIACGYGGPRDRRRFARAMGSEGLHTKLRDWEDGASANAPDLLSCIVHIARTECAFLDSPEAVASWILMGGEMPLCLKVRLGYGPETPPPGSGGASRVRGLATKAPEQKILKLRAPELGAEVAVLDGPVLVDREEFAAVLDFAKAYALEEMKAGNPSHELTRAVLKLEDTAILPEDSVDSINKKKWIAPIKVA